MSLLPQFTHLGKLQMLEVYEYYDVPCLFSCRNASGHIFLAVWKSQTKDYGTWLYVPLSYRKFEEIRSGRIDLRDAFLTSEDGFVYEVIIPCNNSHDRVETIPSEHLIDDWLPMSGEFLDFGSESLPTLEIKESSQ